MTQLIRRQWRLAVVVTLACVVLAALITRILPHRYQSEMKFLVNNERADLVITPGKDQTTTTPSEVSETEVNSEIELMKSNDLLRDIVLNRKLYLPFQRGKMQEPSRKSVELATRELSKELSVSSLRKTDIIAVTYKAADPDAAVAVLEDIGNGYLASHLAAHSAPGTNKFFGEQVARYEEELAQARAALALYHQHEQLFSMPQQQTALVSRLDAVSARLEDVTAEIAVQQTRLQESTRQLSKTPERLVTQVRHGGDLGAMQQLTLLLTQLTNRKIELATKFKPTDRLVLENAQEIANTTHELEHVRQEPTNEETTDLNPVHQSITSDSAKSQIDLSGLRAERESLQQMRQDTLQQLSLLDHSSLQLDSLEERVKQADDNYLIYSHRLSEARLDQALDREKLSNVVMIEKPVASPIAVSPNVSLNLIFGLVLGLCLSFGLCYTREFRQGGSPLAQSGSRGLPHFPIFEPTSGD